MAILPDLLFRQSMVDNRQVSFGERDVRYATYTEQRLFPLGSSSVAADDNADNLKPEFAAYVDCLRELLVASRDLTAQAQGLRPALERQPFATAGDRVVN